MQRRFSLLVCLLAAIAIFAAPQAFADPISIGDKIKFEDRPGSPGGEYGVRKWNGSSYGSELFVTFCVQQDEFLDFHSGGFIVQDISTQIILGNVALDTKTAYLYTQFRQGGLAAHGYTGDATTANALQKALWYFQGEVTFASLPALSKTFVALADSAVSSSLWSGLGNVRVLNIVWATSRNGHDEGDHAQDVLVLIPTPMASVAGMGLMGGIVACGVIRRRAKNALI